jgi:hypothetical protein
MRDFFPAGIAPGCPEVQQNRLAPIVRKTQLLSTQLRKGEVGSQRVLGDGGADASPPVMMGNEIKSRGDGDRGDTGQNSFSECRAQKLLSLGNWIAFLDPVHPEIARNIEYLHIGKAHCVQRVVGRLDVRTMVPRATSAIDNDELVSGQSLHTFTQLLYAALA